MSQLVTLLGGHIVEFQKWYQEEKSKGIVEGLGDLHEPARTEEGK